MSASSKEIEGEALAWLVRVNDPAFTGWDAWELWLTADSRHAEAYWRLAEADADMIEALKSAPLRPVAPVTAPRRAALPRRWAIAAAVAVLGLGLAWLAWTERAQPWSIGTAPGETRTVALADGSRVTMDGATRLTLDRGDPREVTLEAGRVLFEVVHDEANPFRVRVAGTTLTDLGTTFDVTRLKDGTRVSVSEGIVRVDTERASATLRPGDSVMATSEGLERRRVSPEDVAEWRHGRLSYSNETLAVVAQDLERVLDRPITVDPSLAARRFSGSLNAKAPPADLKTRLSRLLDVSIVEDGEGWRLEP